MTGIAGLALGQLMALAGRGNPAFADIRVGARATTGSLYADEAVAASLAATGVLAADLWEMRTGQTQTVRVDTREAAAAIDGPAHLVFADPSRAPAVDRPGGTPAWGFFPTRDGRHIFLHPSFPHTARGLHALMGSPADREAVTRAVMGWDARDLEDEIVRRGLCGAMARTPDEWAATDQGRLLAAQPLVEIERTGDSPPEPMPDGGDSPLSGIRVLDLTRILAGPACARTLAQHGAEVLHIASPDLPTVKFVVPETNPGKLSAWLDLTAEAGRTRLGELAARADVFTQSYRAGALDRLGFGPDDLARVRPGIVHVSINAYGHEGPWRTRGGWEQLAQTVAGIAHLHCRDDGPQLHPGGLCDYTTGFLAAFGALEALKRRARDGGSYRVRVSLARTAMWLTGLGVAEGGRMASFQPLTPDEIAGFRIESDSGYGRLSRLRPPVMLSATPARWTRPAVPLGTHEAAWPRATAIA